MNDSKSTMWPALPYKGLSFYGPADRPIFAGRDKDVLPCARLLGAGSTRVLLLYGRTGCGKSSFLRAALVPFLESPERGFRFLKESGSPKALFVRSTDAPSVKLAECIHAFASKPYEIQTPEGSTGLDLSTALLDFHDVHTFGEKVGTDIRLLLESLTRLAFLVPHTLVLIIDQAEEVLTMNSGAEGQELRDQFFDFLALFSKSRIDLKLLIAFRSEFLAEFKDEIQRREWDTQNIREFMLKDLDEEQTIEAIVRPTLQIPLNDFGIPYRHYHFRYSNGLPKKISRDLARATPQGGKLPVLQIVCGRLYKQSMERAGEGREFLITEEDYRALGGVEGQLVAHVKDILTTMCLRNGLRDQDHVRSEIIAWVNVFKKLWKVQVDGTVTKELATAEDLAREARSSGCRVRFLQAMNFLEGEEYRVLTDVYVLNLETRLPLLCYTLGHDAIGLALKSWPIEADEYEATKARVRKISFFLGLVQIGIGLVLSLSGLKFPNVPKDAAIFLFAYGLVFVLVAIRGVFEFLEESRLFRVLFRAFQRRTEVGRQETVKEADAMLRVTVAITKVLADLVRPQVLPMALAKDARELEAFRKDCPLHRELHIVLARLYFERLQDYDKAIHVLTEFLRNKESAGETTDRDTADALYNRACYYSWTSTLAKTEEAERLRNLALEDLEKSFKLLPENLRDAAIDPDFRPLRDNERFRSLVRE